jgi:hypothetical protein
MWMSSLWEAHLKQVVSTQAWNIKYWPPTEQGSFLSLSQAAEAQDVLPVVAWQISIQGHHHYDSRR